MRLLPGDGGEGWRAVPLVRRTRSGAARHAAIEETERSGVMHQQIDRERVTAPVRLMATLSPGRKACAVLLHYREWNAEEFEAGFYVGLVWTDTGEELSGGLRTRHMSEAAIEWLCLTSDPAEIETREFYRAIEASGELCVKVKALGGVA